MTRILLSTLASFFLASAALAHGGHTQIVDGHAHSLLELALAAATPVALGLAMIALILYARGRKS